MIFCILLTLDKFTTNPGAKGVGGIVWGRMGDYAGNLHMVT